MANYSKCCTGSLNDSQMSMLYLNSKDLHPCGILHMTNLDYFSQISLVTYNCCWYTAHTSCLTTLLSISAIGSSSIWLPCQQNHKRFWEKENRTNWLALISGCRIGIRIRCLHNKTTGFYVIEGLGGKQQFTNLAEMVSLLETFETYDPKQRIYVFTL